MKRTTKDEIRQAEKNGEAAKHRHRGRMNLVSVEAGRKREQGSSRWGTGIITLLGGPPHCDDLGEIAPNRQEQASDDAS